MHQSTPNQIFIGIAFTASCIGLLLIGLAVTSSLSSGAAFDEHGLFMPGLACIAMGVLSLFILYLARPNE